MADRHGHRGGDRGGGRPAVVVRGGAHVSGNVVVRGGGPVRVVTRPRYSGPVRQNRRVITRRATYVNDGRYVLGGGVTVRYTRPVIRERYYNVRVRPSVIVESYPSQSGYLWVTGQWAWDGYEWQWQSGHYEP
ncbi:MAG: hypothetical protein NT062_01650, partial [Proteobacteria bacterium]|nr:hypothetical protein [Pseudomonadota bacterium]